MSIKIWSTNQSYRPWRLDVIIVDVRYQFQFWNRSTSLWLTVAYLFKLLFHVVKNPSVTEVRLSDEGISALKTSPVAKAYALLCIYAFLSLFSFFSPVSLSFVSVLLLSAPPSSPRAYFQALKLSSSHYCVMRPPVVKGHNLRVDQYGVYEKCIHLRIHWSEKRAALGSYWHECIKHLNWYRYGLYCFCFHTS